MDAKIPSHTPLLFALVMVVSSACQPGNDRVGDQTVASGAAPPASQLAQFTPDGMLVKPEGWEAWVMVGASLGLTYAEPGAAGSASNVFHNVYMQPWAYEHFVEAGEFAEGTMFVLALYEASQNADPARGGFYEGELTSSMDIHVKKSDAHESGWGFYAFNGEATSAAMIPGSAACYSCHAENTALDNVFVQFYPTLRPMLPQPGGP